MEAKRYTLGAEKTSEEYLAGCMEKSIVRGCQSMKPAVFERRLRR